MDIESVESKYKLKEMELNALLEITQAINSNLPEQSLYKIYDFTLRASLNISKLTLYVKDEKWTCKANFGTEADFSEIPLDRVFLDRPHTGLIDHSMCESAFDEFEQVIPIAHKDDILAFVFLSGRTNETGEALYVNTNFVQALSNIIIVAIENKKLARKQMKQEIFNKEMEIAANVQKMLLPDSLPQSGFVKVVADYKPHHSVGGDYYDFIPFDEDSFLICIADVSGKGVPAALLMSNFQASLRTIARKTTCLKEIVAELNFQIKGAGTDNFITFFIASYDRRTKLFSYVNAGHNPPVLFDGKGHIQLLKDGTTVLGFFDPLPFLNEGTISGLEDFTLFCYTDGLTECFDEEGVEFGQERLVSYLNDSAKLELKEMHTGLLGSVREFAGHDKWSDDITLLTCRVGG
ncbi:hypothetical protein FUAX_30470 [Fulvitalea axinellae]|uniref:PPM-type phosphatase domain-containing protein n=1 Tax=Fulvitalea axinellae TaxID=1182444 RepID=A0AAU9DHP2_9BACT|nr:hypothetical protein FUAX_30470 [Fulvitalea axinellae]